MGEREREEWKEMVSGERDGVREAKRKLMYDCKQGPTYTTIRVKGMMIR